jgi:methionine-rich copper-binding protein CopC
MRTSRFALILAALAAFTGPQLASAHASLVSSTPAANATVARPTKIELRFNEAVIGSTANTEVVMTGMPGMANHAPMPMTGFTSQMGKDRKSMTLLLRRPLMAGIYRVTWFVAGADTHRMSGNFSFTVR